MKGFAKFTYPLISARIKDLSLPLVAVYTMGRLLMLMACLEIAPGLRLRPIRFRGDLIYRDGRDEV